MGYYQISSGKGPVECEEAVFLFLDFLTKQKFCIEIIQTEKGEQEGTLKSVYLKSQDNFDDFLGSIKWEYISRFRPNHKRKNWFISFQKFEENNIPDFDENKVTFSTMRAGGHGGQNVNKVETAVRATYIPAGYSTVCSDERSQLSNKKRAIDRIKLHLMLEAQKLKLEKSKNLWNQHNSIERGNPVLVFRGGDFKLEN